MADQGRTPPPAARLRERPAISDRRSTGWCLRPGAVPCRPRRSPSPRPRARSDATAPSAGRRRRPGTCPPAHQRRDHGIQVTAASVSRYSYLAGCSQYFLRSRIPAPTSAAQAALDARLSVEVLELAISHVPKGDFHSPAGGVYRPGTGAPSRRSTAPGKRDEIGSVLGRIPCR